jgi:redox-sensitive bicupin YhaK (pirin superfamily)
MSGRGVMHEEVPQVNGIAAEGLQIFINLKEKNKMLPPTSFHVDKNEAPHFEHTNLNVKVISGVYCGIKAIFQAPEPTQIFDVSINGLADLNKEERFYEFENMFSDRCK